MHLPKISDLVRSGGYEVLFLLAEASALAIHPTMRNAEQLQVLFDRLRDEHHLASLQKRGLLATGHSGSPDALQLTELGQAVFQGGRDPEQEWARTWDGQWRLLSFDLPRNERAPRLRFWRWLRANHFGNLQGSLWITPDPVPAIERTATQAGFDPSAVMIFTGNASGKLTAKQMAEKAWNFQDLNANYDRYQSFAKSTLATVRKTRIPPDRLRKLLNEDRQLWWKALRPDPLLPKALLPRHYEALRALKLRRQLHKAVFQNLDLPSKP